jgi:diguanylate cyclase (GGDEF)-like protein
VALLAICVLAALALIVPLLRDLQRLHERTAEEAVTDGLTGLSNHRRFQQVIRKEVERAKRFDRPLSMLMIDLDDFKQVNDTYGHLQGDHVLRQVATMLTSESREVDEPARYGGEEFALVLPETGVEGALEVAERIRSRLESTSIALTDRDVEFTMKGSVGVAGTPDVPLDVKTLVKAADDALYRAKWAGKNRIVRAQRSTEGDRLRT